MSRALLGALLAAVLAALLASCSAVRFAYNNSQALVRFEADEYFDLDEAQALEFRERLSRYHGWHREVELPAYAALLDSARSRVAAGVRPGDVAWAIAALRGRYHAAIARAIEDAAPVVTTLRESQYKTLEKKLAEGNRKYEKEFLSGEPRRQHRARTKRMWQRFRDWIGDLSDEQEAHIERFVREHARYTALRFEDRKHWQRDAVALMKRYRKPEDLAPRLAAVFTHPETRRSAQYLREAARWEADLADLIADIDRTLTPEQRRRLLRRIDNYAEDFRALSGSPGATRAAAVN
ncbi:MAG: hypothetical protein HYY28_00330 [Betaproteobacteria bacterium]|nr:hypothetical protein [Betaproteobacteria bacterium]